MAAGGMCLTVDPSPDCDCDYLQDCLLIRRVAEPTYTVGDVVGLRDDEPTHSAIQAIYTRVCWIRGVEVGKLFRLLYIKIARPTLA